jgi:hypothetical protein
MMLTKLGLGSGSLNKANVEVSYLVQGSYSNVSCTANEIDRHALILMCI